MTPPRRIFWTFLLLSFLLGAAQPTNAVGQGRLSGKIVGQVLDQRDRAPVSGAEVRIRGTGLIQLSDRGGRFSFPTVPSGPKVLEVSHLSYRVRTDSILVIGDETLEIEVAVAPDPLPLEPLLVSVRSRVLEDGGFYRRRAQGLSGHMFTREQIQERNPNRLTDMFISIPGVRVAQRDGVAGPVVLVPRGKLLDGGTDSCYPTVWMDGIATDMRDLDMVSPDHLEGLEVYVGARTPLRFNSDCGAILIWTYLPEKRGGG